MVRTKKAGNPNKMPKLTDSQTVEQVEDLDVEESISEDIDTGKEHGEVVDNNNTDEELKSEIFEGFDLSILDTKLPKHHLRDPLPVSSFKVQVTKENGKDRYHIEPTPGPASITDEFLDVFGPHLSFVGKDITKESVADKSNPKKRTREETGPGPRHMVRKAKDLWLEYKTHEDLPSAIFTKIKNLYIRYIQHVLIRYPEKPLRVLVVPKNVPIVSSEVSNEKQNSLETTHQTGPTQITIPDGDFVTTDDIQQLMNAFQQKFNKQSAKIRFLQETITRVEKTFEETVSKLERSIQETISRIETPSHSQPKHVPTYGTPSKTVPKATPYKFRDSDEE